MKNNLYLINGPLGAGKTTLLKFLLKQDTLQGSRVIENEFASISVDSEELHDHVKEIETIAGLCICCSTGEELIDALRKLSSENRPVIIEATGVANSLKLVEKLVVNDMLELYDIAKAFFVIDAAEIAADESILSAHAHELEAADVVVLTKSDLLDTRDQAETLAAVQATAKGRVVTADMGTVNENVLEGESQILTYFANSDAEFTNHDGETNYTIVQTSDLLIEPAKLEAAWNTLKADYGLKRLKGNFIDASGTSWHVEATPSQLITTKQQASSAPQLVFIGKQARLVTADVLKELL